MKHYGNLILIAVLAVGLFGCSNREVGTTVGAATGAGIGYAATDGNAAGTVIGAGAGALVGNQVGKHQDKKKQ